VHQPWLGQVANLGIVLQDALCGAGYLRQNHKLPFQVTVKVFMRSNRFEKYQVHVFVKRVTQKIQQTATVKFVHAQSSQVTLLAITNVGVCGDIGYRGIKVCRSVVVKLFVLAGKPARLQGRPTHA
jgi:hypothetical protein